MLRLLFAKNGLSFCIIYSGFHHLFLTGRPPRKKSSFPGASVGDRYVVAGEQLYTSVYVVVLGEFGDTFLAVNIEAWMTDQSGQTTASCTEDTACRLCHSLHGDAMRAVDNGRRMAETVTETPYFCIYGLSLI